MIPMDALGSEEEQASSAVARRRRRRRSRSSSGSRSRLPGDNERVLVGSLALCTLGSALALGSAHPLAALALSSALLLTGAYASLWGGVRLALAGPSLCMALLAAYSFFQSVPFPSSALSWLAGHNAEVWRGAFRVVDEPVPSWLPLSLDPAASRVEGVKWLGYGVAFALAARVGARRPEAGPAIVFGSALAVGVISLAHRLVEAERVYGLYAPVGEFARTSIGPLLNPNNLAGYLNLGALCGIGLMLSSSTPLRRWTIGLAVAALMGITVETGSRAGLLALLVGVVALVGLVLRLRTKLSGNWSRRTALLAIVGSASFGVVLALLALSPRMVSGIEDSGFSKLAMTSWVRPLLADYPWFGVGRGAFESAFQEYRVGENNLIYSHPENLPLQWAAEWGLPVALVAGVAFAELLRPGRVSATTRPVAVGAWAGALALVVQNLADLGLELPALALALCVALGSCWGHAAPRQPQPDWRVRSWGPALGAGAVAAATLFATGTESVGAARLRLDEMMEATDVAQPAQLESLRSELYGAMLRHPADPYFPRLGAILAFRTGDSPMAWINRSLERGGGSGRTHYLLARLLLLYGRTDQGLLELRYAAGYDPELIPRVARLALGASRQVSVLRRAVPEGRVGGRLLVAMARELKSPADRSIHLALLRSAVEVAPDLAEARAVLAEEMLKSLQQARAEECADAQREDCLRTLHENAVALRRLQPEKSQGVELLARWAMLQGNLAQAEKLLVAECERVTIKRRCLLLLLEVVAKTRDTARTQSIARQAAASPCSGLDDCARLYASIGDALTREGLSALALTYYLQAARDDRSDARWLRVADLASSVGQHALAVEALGKVKRLRTDPALQRRLNTERMRAAGQALPRTSPKVGP